jgi:hypothetical protein
MKRSRGGLKRKTWTYEKRWMKKTIITNKNKRIFLF